jgi:alkylation response protein AidB-like acyl-CoA dehydrogenase
VTDSLWIRGRKIEASDLEQIRSWRAAHPDWSRRRLSQELARHWDWRTPAGQLKDIATRDLLNGLEARGLLALPARQRRGGRQRPRAVQAPAQGWLALQATPPSAGPVALGQLLPLCWPFTTISMRANRSVTATL